MYKSEEQWEQNGIDYKEWHNVPEKDIAYYDYADYSDSFVRLAVFFAGCIYGNGIRCGRCNQGYCFL